MPVKVETVALGRTPIAFVTEPTLLCLLGMTGVVSLLGGLRQRTSRRFSTAHWGPLAAPAAAAKGFLLMLVLHVAR